MCTPFIDDLEFNMKLDGSLTSSPNLKNIDKKFHKPLVMSKSSPNIIENFDGKEKLNSSQILFKNLSTNCLNSPPLLNPHKALIELYKKYSGYKGSSYVNSFSSRKKKFRNLEDIYSYCNKENTFTVKIRKNGRGLGLSICGGKDDSCKDPFAQLIRIWNLHPLQPALECGKLTLGDVILEVNGTSMLGFTNTEAVEVLRAAPADVELKIFRPSKFLIPSFSTFKKSMHCDSNCSFSTANNVLSITDNTSWSVESGEFKVTLKKQSGCLGFTILRQENTSDSFGGIYIKALTREHAVLDGRIRPGDRILQVNGTDVSSFSFSEALTCLRNAPEVVTLKLCRNCKIMSSCPKHLLPKVHTFNVILEKCPNQTLGFVLWNSLDAGADTLMHVLPCAAEVKTVYANSPADENKIKMGDRILEVNGESLIHKTADEVIDILRKTDGVVRMVFCRLQQDHEDNS